VRTHIYFKVPKKAPKKSTLMRQSLSSLGSTNKTNKGGVSHCGLCHLHFKNDVKAKRRVMETQIFSPCKKKKNLIFKNSLLKKPKSFKILL
jgi:hypothetical protein